MIPRRAYRDDVQLSVVGFGGIAVMGMEQRGANAIVAEAVEAGVNYFDVAPSYGNGEAEEKLGPALEPHRRGVFLACKTMARDAAGAARDLERSLRRLRTDCFDLYQFHAMGVEPDDVKRITAPGGAAETLFRARDQGKTRYVGFSAHSVDAALELLDLLPVASVMLPINFVSVMRGNFGPQVLKRAREKGIARLALKALAQTTLKSGEPRALPKCWYRPIEDPDLLRLALRFTLGEDVTAAVMPGEVKLLRLGLEAARDIRPLSPDERRELFARSEGMEPLFRER
jgi:aryl-alcohol dehydrogenase-like predicted oxidoreductase